MCNTNGVGTYKCLGILQIIKTGHPGSSSLLRPPHKWSDLILEGKCKTLLLMVTVFSLKLVNKMPQALSLKLSVYPIAV